MIPRLRTVLGLAGLVALLLAGLWALWAAERGRDEAVRAHDAAVAAAADSAAAARRRDRQREAEIARERAAAAAAQRQADSLAVVLRQWQARVRPVGELVPPTIPDTCATVVADLVEQSAVRDSVIATQELLLEVKDSALAAYDRVNAGITRQYIAAREQWSRWEHLAKHAPVRRDPRLELDGTALVGLQGAASEARAGATVRIDGPLHGRVEYVIGESARGLRVGAQLRVRIL